MQNQRGEDLPLVALSTENSDTQDDPSRRDYTVYREIFNSCDQDGDGKVSIKELYRALRRTNNIKKHVVYQLLASGDKNGDGVLDIHEFTDMMMSNPKLKYLLRSKFERYVENVVPRRRDDMDQEDGIYEMEYTFCPPPIGLLILAIITVILFVIDEVQSPDTIMFGTGPIGKTMMYDPQLRYEAWRYITYMFVHAGYAHLVINLIMLLLLGVPLEMVHKSWRILTIYCAGVIAGSLATSVTDPTTRLVGASAGVYAVLTAHIATLIMNWKEMQFALIQMLIFSIIVVADLGSAVYDRYIEENDASKQIGVVAHLAGAATGICVGIDVLRNLRVKRWEKYFKWIALIIFVLCIGSAIILNIFWTEYFPEQI